MAALTADIFDARDRARGVQSPWTVANGQVIYANSLVGVNSAGFLVPWANTAGHRFVGRAIEGCTGNTSVTPAVTCIVSEFDELPSALVASGVQASVGALIYCATDNPADFQLGATANVKAVGVATRFRAAGVLDVRLFNLIEYHGLN